MASGMTKSNPMSQMLTTTVPHILKEVRGRNGYKIAMNRSMAIAINVSELMKMDMPWNNGTKWHMTLPQTHLPKYEYTGVNHRDVKFTTMSDNARFLQKFYIDLSIF